MRRGRSSGCLSPSTGGEGMSIDNKAAALAAIVLVCIILAASFDSEAIEPQSSDDATVLLEETSPEVVAHVGEEPFTDFRKRSITRRPMAVRSASARLSTWNPTCPSPMSLSGDMGFCRSVLLSLGSCEAGAQQCDHRRFFRIRNLRCLIGRLVHTRVDGIQDLEQCGRSHPCIGGHSQHQFYGFLQFGPVGLVGTLFQQQHGRIIRCHGPRLFRPHQSGVHPRQ